jgi:hypothetical protein
MDRISSKGLVFILFAATNETFAMQTPATKRLIPTRVKYILHVGSFEGNPKRERGR